MKYYLIAGEASGDLHASNLMKEIKKEDPNALFRYLGGDLMILQGGTCAKHYKETAYMGFVDVFMHLRSILKNINYIKHDLLEFKPDVVILVDYPGFNLRIAEFAHNAGLKVFYYISPKIWAWKQSRVHKIKRYIDTLFIIFPFEKDFYKKFEYEVEYVGNPIMDAIDFKKPDSDAFKKEYALDDHKVVALLPGSRKREIEHNFPIMLKVAAQFPNLRFLVAGAPSLDKTFIGSFIDLPNVKLLYNQTHEVLRHADAALVTSGTATLETAILNIPEVCCYKGDNLSYHIAKRLIKVKFISLVNLVMEKEIIKEYIQFDMTVEKLSAELNKLLFDDVYRNTMLNHFEELRQILGGKGASERTAKKIVKQLLMVND